MLNENLEGEENVGLVIYLCHPANETWMVLYMIPRGAEAIEYNRWC